MLQLRNGGKLPPDLEDDQRKGPAAPGRSLPVASWIQVQRFPPNEALSMYCDGRVVNITGDGDAPIHHVEFADQGLFTVEQLDLAEQIWKKYEIGPQPDKALTGASVLVNTKLHEYDSEVAKWYTGAIKEFSPFRIDGALAPEGAAGPFHQVLFTGAYMQVLCTLTCFV